MSSQRKKVLLTGATGGVGKTLADAFIDEYDLIEHGHTPANERQKTSLVPGDLANYDEVRALMDGVDTVVNMAGAAAPDSSWDDVLSANIIGVRNVLEAARDAGVRRAVLASSNHAMGMYDRYEEWPVYPTTPPRPDSLYGVSKVFGETLSRYYYDEYGLEVINLRIGWVGDDPMSVDEDILHAMWLSPGDAVRVVRCAIEAETPFGIYYAISDNPNARWSTVNTRLELGYRPEDSWTDAPGVEEEVIEDGAEVRDNWPKDS